MNFINNVQKYQEQFSTSKRAGGRFLRRWNKKKLVPRPTKCIAIHGETVLKCKKKVCRKSATSEVLGFVSLLSEYLSYLLGAEQFMLLFRIVLFII
jgi:hypothetical protein